MINNNYQQNFRREIELACKKEFVFKIKYATMSEHIPYIIKHTAVANPIPFYKSIA